MAMQGQIGIDVGGTNTDAVLMRGSTLHGAVKTPTTPDVMSGITTALRELLQGAGRQPTAIGSVMIGTTHFTNAVIERRALERVAAIRIGLPAAYALKPFAGWPEDLRRAVAGPSYLLRGGHEYDGRPIVPFDRDAMKRAADEIAAEGLHSVAITAVFSPLTNAAELEAAEILRAACPGIKVTLSSDLGRIGLLERENATLLNASLRGLASRTTAAFRQSIIESGLNVPLYLTQNDGTLMSAEVAEEFPVLCFASGPTNSMRGASHLAGLQDAVVLDIGGTTTDIGVLHHGFPREANALVEVGGVRTQFRMPDVFSIGLGGGTRVSRDPLRIGPSSVGYRLQQSALVFGGTELTLTDVGVAAGLIDLGDRSAAMRLPGSLVDDVQTWVKSQLEQAVDRIKTQSGDVRVVAVGGGAFLVPDRLDGVAEVVRVPHSGVANAIGAAMAQVSGEIDRIFHDDEREQALAKARKLAEDRAIAAGAKPDNLILADMEDMPLAYIPGNARRVRARVIGDIAV